MEFFETIFEKERRKWQQWWLTTKDLSSLLF
jgi:hypothetical protein